MLSGLDVIDRIAKAKNKEVPVSSAPTTEPVSIEPIRQQLRREAMEEAASGTVFGKMLTEMFYPSPRETTYEPTLERPEPGIRPYEPSTLKSIFDKISGWWHTPDVSKAKAQNIVAISEATGLPPSEIYRHYDEIVERLLPGAIPSPRKKIIGGAMDVGIALGMRSHPVATVLALGRFFGIDELENLAVSWLKGKPYKFQEGLGLADYFEAEGFSRDALDVIDFIWKAIATGATSRLGIGLFGAVTRGFKNKAAKIKFINKVCERVKGTGKSPDKVIVDEMENLGIDPETIDKAHSKILEIEKKQLAEEPDRFGEWIKEDLEIKGKRIKKIKQAKKYIADEAIHRAMESIKEKKAKPKKKAKAKKPTKTITLYRAYSPTAKFEDIFDSARLTEFKPPEGIEGKFYTSDLDYAEYFKETYGKDAVIESIEIPLEEAKKYEVRPGEYFVPEA